MQKTLYQAVCMDLLKYLRNEFIIFISFDRIENCYVEIYLLPQMHHLPEGEKMA